MKLIRLLKRAHAIEIGAYNAYEGHWRNVKDERESARIRRIQSEEGEHGENLRLMLMRFGQEPSLFQDFILWCIGKTISAGCYIFGYRMAMWGAKVMEVLGAGVYKNLVQVAKKDGHLYMAAELYSMQRAEESHELFFKECLQARKTRSTATNKATEDSPASIS